MFFSFQNELFLNIFTGSEKNEGLLTLREGVVHFLKSNVHFIKTIP